VVEAELAEHRVGHAPEPAELVGEGEVLLLFLVLLIVGIIGDVDEDGYARRHIHTYFEPPHRPQAHSLRRAALAGVDAFLRGVVFGLWVSIYRCGGGSRRRGIGSRNGVVRATAVVYHTAHPQGVATTHQCVVARQLVARRQGPRRPNLVALFITLRF
jgi:hypothetical protein